MNHCTLEDLKNMYTNTQVPKYIIYVKYIYLFIHLQNEIKIRTVELFYY